MKQTDCMSLTFVRSMHVLLVFVVLGLFFSLVYARSGGEFSGSRIESVHVQFMDGQQGTPTYRDAILNAFSASPGSQYDPVRSNLKLSQVRRLKFVQKADYQIETSGNGNVILTLQVTLSDAAKPLAESAMGVLANGDWGDFPTLYADESSVLQAKLENKSMIFSNTNAFFGRPDLLTMGNPLAISPSGRGTDTWAESSVELGLYGLNAITEQISVFAGASVIASGSLGPELFTDESRVYTGVEDAYFGVIGRNTTEQGGVRQMSLLYGRKAFQIDNGMIIRLSSANGGERAALQSNPRNAAEELIHAQFVYDAHKLELFRLDPDELVETDSKTRIHGVNYEGQVLPQLRLGAMLLQVPQSNFSYYTTNATYSRQGLRVADLRLAYDTLAEDSNFYARAEFARQTNENFDMDARAGYVEAGYQLLSMPWRPTLSYRYAKFTGDNPDTPTFERWDPLFAGGGGDEWVQGLNQYKVVQTSNVISHRFMSRMQPAPRWELTPQFWIFKADTLNNLGGAQALSVLQSDDLGMELNLTARYVANPNLIFVFSAAYTKPGEAIRKALNDDYRNWFSASAFMIARF
ncbi:alginate export family protein [Deefgea piscis]|uniref:alginate export family protein n=1 Tax=Deefgea piscis TaxID=2739061 RepID=UPI001C7E8F03|nr:alginate export family protein [Deefgea piscis]QZA79966.1 alginate export family protein [Deefgea piscis]